MPNTGSLGAFKRMKHPVFSKVLIILLVAAAAVVLSLESRRDSAGRLLSLTDAQGQATLPLVGKHGSSTESPLPTREQEQSTPDAEKKSIGAAQDALAIGDRHGDAVEVDAEGGAVAPTPPPTQAPHMQNPNAGDALSCRPPKIISNRKFYLYKDHQDQRNAQLVPLVIPESAAQNSHVSFKTDAGAGIVGYDGTGSSAMAEFLFSRRLFDVDSGGYVEVTVPENWMGLVLATNGGFGNFPGVCVDLSGAFRLSLQIRSDSKDNPADVQIRAFTWRAGGYGDTAKTDVVVDWFKVGTHWRSLDIPIDDDLSLDRVMTPFQIMVKKSPKSDRVRLYLDEIYYEFK